MVSLSPHQCFIAEIVRTYDERKSLEPAYPPVPASKAGDTSTKEVRDDAELEKLIHAPPGYV